MLEEVPRLPEVAKAHYKEERRRLDLGLARLQREARAHNIPVLLFFEGWDAAGKGTLIGKLIDSLDPRGYTFHAHHEASDEESRRPRLWREWMRTPPRGHIAIYDRGPFHHIAEKRMEKAVSRDAWALGLDDLVDFERLLVADGAVVIKFFLHISRKEQKKRLTRLAHDEDTAWRVTKADWRRHRRYDKYHELYARMLVRTEHPDAPWLVLDATDDDAATLAMYAAVHSALEKAIKRRQGAPGGPSEHSVNPIFASPLEPAPPVAFSSAMTLEEYSAQIGELQKHLKKLEFRIFQKRIPVLIGYEGWDAAGKGGNIRRLTEKLEPRGFSVIPIAAPTTEEKAHHYLWRFWRALPKDGHLVVFDRTWYGRVLVERVEGFCQPHEWQRAYGEINRMERQILEHGTVLVKFWLEVDPDEQLRRFKERQADPDKQWKITDEDWRNREKMPQYRLAVDEMLARTSTEEAPWTVVESNNKLFARIKALKTVIGAIEAKL
jgi:polyphosphate:AMP phosphotransferase